uniref:Reverse transcriptase domain-containing protein n=1 Tax=Nelumbo nucifera TaxID=4432 RepID=A0A822ZRP2_NELNU|nr:TPA_asm: hypothetical protein HUJ06_004421 [Nelumbo nucifera]
MICLSWNCRGLGNPRAVRDFRELICSRKPDVIFLFKTLVHVNKIEEIRIQISFVGAFAMDREGRGGGIAFLWKNPNICSLLDYLNNHINVLTGFYGYPDRSRRRDSWNLLHTICASSRLPWCCIGDFNDMLSPEDKRGRLDHPNWLLARFRETISDCHLHEISIIGSCFTWERGRGTKAWVQKELIGLLLQESVCRGWVMFLLVWIYVEKALAKWGSGLNQKFTRDIAQCKAVIERLKDNSISSDIETCSKSFWLRDGDANTKYFHTAASTRKRTNRISRLMDDEGNWHDDPSSLCQVVQDYFRKLFSLSSSHAIDGFDFVDCKISDSDNEKLLSPFSFEEFKEVVFQMHLDKSPGPEEFPASLNDTTIVLIPTCESPKTMKDLRPISLCNVLYKIVSKVLANRLKVLLPNIILNAQSTFMPGRAITDNVLVAFELIHFMRMKRKGKVGEVALKIDISKAHDRVDWQFLKLMMQKLGFSNKWIRLIMLCVTIVFYFVAFNGMEVGPIIPGRGLRQGDSLSPYLFILCAKGLFALMYKAEREGLISCCRICRGAPSVSHLLFADDRFFLFKVEERECNAMKNILKVYEEASGQAINFQVRCARETSVLGVVNPINTRRYLGLPSQIGRKKNEVFRFIRDCLWQRLQGWKSKLLSRVGKEVLIKYVAQAVPSYCMSTFMIPVSLSKELERMMNSFWWGNSNSNEGGMGFRDMQPFNLEMLAKQGWNIISNPNALVCRVFKAKYFPRGNFLHSHIVLEKGCRWRIGNGQHIRVWDDPCLKEMGNFKVDSPRSRVLAVYSVKLGYRVARDLNTTISQAVISGGWDKLWKLPIPPKVKSFVRRVCRGCLPYTSCHLCNTNVESLSHVLLSCPYAQACWSKAGISANVSNHASFADCHLEFLAETDYDKSRRACMVLWSIWSQRNSKLWKNNFKLPDHAVTGSLQLLHDWKQLQIQKRLGMVINLNHQGDGNWRAPPPGSFKCNVDAASFTSSNLTGFRIVLRDELGAFMKGYTSTVPGLFVSKEGEVMALIAAIKWVTSMDIQNVVFEIDALIVWKALRAPALDLSEFGSLAHECSSLILVSGMSL